GPPRPARGRAHALLQGRPRPGPDVLHGGPARARPGAPLPARPLRGRGLLRAPAARGLPGPGRLLHHVPLLRRRDDRPVPGLPALVRAGCPEAEALAPVRPRARSPTGARMNVAIVGSFPFPNGSASAARVRNFALGLRECGARVHVISMAPRPRA